MNASDCKSDCKSDAIHDFGTDDSKRKVHPWKPNFSKEFNLEREIRMIINKWSQANMATGVQATTKYLLENPDNYRTFVNEYIKSILKAKPDFKEKNKANNEVVTMQSHHFSKCLRQCKKTNVKLQRDLSSHLYRCFSERIRSDLRDPDFKHSIGGTFYIMAAKHAEEEVMPSEEFSLICLMAAKYATSEQHHLAVFELLQSGNSVICTEVLKLLMQQCKKKLPTLMGRPYYCYQALIKANSERTGISL